MNEEEQNSEKVSETEERILNLSYRMISQLLHYDLEGKDDTTCLRLQGNQIGQFPTGIFDPLKKLEILKLGYNRFRKLPSRLFSSLKNLRELYLDASRLEELPPSLFASQEQLRILSLSGNRLSGFPAGLFSPLKNLKSLDLSENRIIELRMEDLQGLNQLEILNLSKMKSLLYLDPRIASECPNLKTLAVWKTSVPANTVSEIQNLLPQCRICTEYKEIRLS